MLTLDSFRADFERWGQLDPAREVVVAYSGGADSTALLTLLVESGVSCVAAHLHHGMRAEADRELALAEAYATELGVPFVSGRADVPGMAAARKIGLEEAGRLARQEFLRQTCARLGVSTVATGHTQDDHIETMLFRMARGSGMKGLTGIPWTRDHLVRPLRGFSRAETREFCESRGLWFHDDPANADIDMARVRVRERVVPELRLVHPGADLALVRLSELVAEEDEFLNGLAARLLVAAEIPLNGRLGFLTQDCEVAMKVEVLRANPAVLMRRAVRLLAEFFGANASYEQVMAVEQLLAQGQRGSVTTEDGLLSFIVDDERLLVELCQRESPFRFPLTVPGETESDEFGWKFTALPSDPTDHQRERGSMEIVLNAAAIKGNLYFRSQESGDKIVPLGMSGQRLLSDALGEAKLSTHARARLPILCDLVGPIWVPGVVMADRVKVTPTSQKGLLVRFSPLD
ncbi:MAG: tRNA lysidine(34) synthetase TilS [Chthonomonas sp.]|nr:tRNA lysidine(34) synthetase TilS [Chthonomonas sp.]